MDPVVYSKFESVLEMYAAKEKFGKILEVGAVPSEASLLRAKFFDGSQEKIGINLDGPHSYKDIHIVKGNANHMDCFQDEEFDLIVCNAMLEHDPFFWRSISEMKRVLKKGGILIIGVPGFDTLKNEEWNEKFKNILRKFPFLQKVFGRKFLGMLFNSTPTFKLHNYPGDFYRFSPQAMKTVFFDGLEIYDIEGVMVPPRLIGIARKNLT
jgi:SAM-dependent methyltransferase